MLKTFVPTHGYHAVTENFLNFLGRQICVGGTAHGVVAVKTCIFFQNPAAQSVLDSLRGLSVKIGKIQRRLAWPLRKDDTHKSRSVPSFLCKGRLVFCFVHARHQATWSMQTSPRQKLCRLTLTRHFQKLSMSRCVARDRLQSTMCRHTCTTRDHFTTSSGWIENDADSN